MRAKLPLPHIFLVLLVLLLTAFPTAAQERAVGVTVHTEDAYDGYALFSPAFDRDVYLIDNDGQVIHKWLIKETAVTTAHLLENGHLIITGAPRGGEVDTSLAPRFYRDGSIREYTWDNELVWEIEFTGAETRQHHGIDIMPNGNILAILWDYHPLDEALAMGLDPRLVDIEFKDNPYLLPDRIIEIERSTGEAVWQWGSWDHLVQDIDPGLPNYGAAAEHPQRIDINYHFWYSRNLDSLALSKINGGNWMGSMSVSYSPELDQAALSVWRFDELWIIDHRAADSAGGLLYRWGNPSAYGQDGQQRLFRPGGVKWIEAGLPGEGNILIFNGRNPNEADNQPASVMELKLPRRPDGSYDWEREAEVVWSYAFDGPHAYYGSAQRLPNGNTLLMKGDHGRLIEVNPNGEVVWEFVNPVSGAALVIQDTGPNNLSQAHKYPADYRGFDGKDMKPVGRLVDYLQA